MHKMGLDLQSNLIYICTPDPVRVFGGSEDLYPYPPYSSWKPLGFFKPFINTTNGHLCTIMPDGVGTLHLYSSTNC